MRDSVKVTVADSTVSFTVGGRHFTARLNSHGGWELDGKHRGEIVSGKHSPQAVKAEVERLDAEDAARKARAKALREAAQRPHPGYMLERGDLVKVGVRGVEARNRRYGSQPALIIDAQGEKDSVRQPTVLRDLTEAEQSQIRQALRQARDAREVREAAKAKGADYNDTARALDPVEVTATWDEEQATLVAEHNGSTYTGNPSQISDRITRDRVAAGFPYYAEKGEVRLTTSSSHLWGTVFATVEDTEAFIAASERAEVEGDRVSALLQQYRFDFSVFTDQKDEEEDSDS